MLNKNRSITNYIFLRPSVGNHMEQLEFAVADLGTHDLFIGHEWLKLHNPNIDWKTSEIKFDQCPKECGYIEDLWDPEADEEDEQVKLEPGDKLYALDIDTHLRKMNIATELAVKAAEGKAKKMLEEMLPPHYLEYQEVFEKKDFDTLPKRRPWDHVIEMTPDFKPMDCKVYPLTGDGQKALEEFLDKNLRTRRIRPSKSLMASPFFFVEKKRWKTTTHTGLSKTQWDDDQK